jgi:hypothetical protein
MSQAYFNMSKIEEYKIENKIEKLRPSFLCRLIKKINNCNVKP